MVTALVRPARRALAALGLLALAACDPPEARPVEFRQMSDSFYFTITSDPIPPRAREAVLYKVVVRDKESRQPIETGVGRMYSSNRDEAKTWDELKKGAELGTYYAKLNYVASGDWAVALEFRRDSAARIEKVEWMQDVLAAREPGSR